MILLNSHHRSSKSIFLKRSSGLNAWGERTIQVDCSFLPQDKKYTIEIFQDKKRSNKNANLYEHKIMDTDNKNIIEMFMASGGGFVMVIREK